jgi:hypothetical protein
MDSTLSEMERTIDRLSRENVSLSRDILQGSIKLQRVLLKYMNRIPVKVFISGKVTGEDYDQCFKKFAQAEIRLTDMGYNVFNPMREVPRDASWSESMKICIPGLVTCTHIHALDQDWYRSAGAQIEMMVAEVMGIQMINLEVCQTQEK